MNIIRKGQQGQTLLTELIINFNTLSILKLIIRYHLAGVVTLVSVVEGGDGAVLTVVPLRVPALVNVQPRHHQVHHKQPDQVAAAWSALVLELQTNHRRSFHNHGLTHV